MMTPPLPLCIVLVDDSCDTADELQEILEADGHRVHVAGDGLRGLEAVLALQPDVALIDLELPGMHGLEVARRIRTHHSTRRPWLIALSGHVGPASRRQTRQAGFDAQLGKPFLIDTLYKLLQQVSRS